MLRYTSIACQVYTFLYTPPINSTERSPFWQVCSSSHNSALPRLLYNSKFRHRVHKSLPLFTVVSQINPFHLIPQLLFYMNFDIASQFTSRSSQWPLYCRVSHQNPVCVSVLLHSCHVRRTSHPPQVWWGVRVRNPLSTLLWWTESVLLCFTVWEKHFRVRTLYIFHLNVSLLTLTLATCTIWWASTNASKWQMGFNL